MKALFSDEQQRDPSENRIQRCMIVAQNHSFRFDETCHCTVDYTATTSVLRFSSDCIFRSQQRPARSSQTRERAPTHPDPLIGGYWKLCDSNDGDTRFAIVKVPGRRHRPLGHSIMKSTPVCLGVWSKGLRSITATSR